MAQDEEFSSPKTQSALAIFCRAPRLGTVKTRLAQTHGDEFALGLYRAMLADTFALGRALAPAVETFACFTPPDAFEGENSLGALWEGPKIAQCEGDLGAKILDCFAQLRGKGFERIVVVGSDSPDMWLAWLQKAFRQLERVDSIMGDTADGGFWVFGASTPLPSFIFDNVVWSGPDVTNQIFSNLHNQKPAQWRMTFLSQWFDCDDQNDLKELRFRLSFSDGRFAPKTREFLENHP